MKSSSQRTILRLTDVIARTGLHKPSIYRFMEKGSFPLACKLGERAVGWYEDEIDAWVEARAEQRITLVNSKIAA